MVYHPYFFWLRGIRHQRMLAANPVRLLHAAAEFLLIDSTAGSTVQRQKQYSREQAVWGAQPEQFLAP